MLELYRASAGSGKTYTLAKKFLWYFLTISSEDRKFRFRTIPELTDSARHILAVTFTNKATNEMQMRIVNSLFDLAYREIEYKKDKTGREIIAKPVYMQDFIDDLNVDIDRIREIAIRGLSILLENYSDFNVSTIDSFFQQVLRTFAYESEINDSYQVELDSQFLSEIGVDSTLQEIDNNADDLHTRFWVKTIMDRTEKGKWNIFMRQNPEEGVSPYKSFIESVKKMETEQYKEIREEIEEYFKSHGDGSKFLQLYNDLKDKYVKPVRDAFDNMLESFKRLRDDMPSDLCNATGDLGNFAKGCEAVLVKHKLKWDVEPEFTKTGKVKEVACLDPDFLESSGPVRKWIAQNPSEGDRLRSLFEDVCEKFNTWFSQVSCIEFRHFKLYTINLPFFALFGIVSRKRQEYLDEVNAIELAETSMILKEVIGDSDAPFIYERLGTKLNHFLIDEFQDTSRMQWSNLSHLLHESISRGNGNLIIGDAKQSIYRFRNADPSLITSVVPEEFKGRVEPKGMIPQENTNYRSQLHVVQFNNSFFRFLASCLDEQNGLPASGRKCFSELYANVVQTPNKTEDSGYVEIHISGDTKSDFKQEIQKEIPLLVTDMLKRGYRQKDICILVSSNKEASFVSQVFIDYNRNLPKEETPIRFVSEQSLKVASSRAVDIIVNVLRNMARGSKPEIRTGEERLKRGVASAQEILANFKFFQMQHPGETACQLDKYLETAGDLNALSELLSEMQSLAIPAIVEAVIAAFIEPETVKKDAIFIAAFQDLVLEYCDNNPTDIGSFLKWWDRKSQSASVSSPEGYDAVQITTVHKSKGLEYACVIVPFAEWEMTDVYPTPNKMEWIWVKPEVINHESITMPPYLPVETSKLLVGTKHEGKLNEYFDLVKMDHLNNAYVAFTRAEKELYIFTSAHDAPKFNPESRSGASSKGIGNYIWRFVEQLGESEDSDSNIDSSPLLTRDFVDIQDEPLIVRIGHKEEKIPQEQNPENSEQENEEEKDNNTPQNISIETYKSHRTPDFLKYREASLPLGLDDSDIAVEESEFDPRSEGNIKHAVLELVKTAEDLPKAVRHLCLSGLIPYTMADEIEKSLADAISQPEVNGWFDGTARVVNERAVLRHKIQKDKKERERPDRIMIYPDGVAVVVDYKFGKIDQSSKYRQQVKDYINLLRATGNFKSVKGFLWYVNQSTIIPVE